MLDRFGAQPQIDPAHLAVVKGWVAETLALPDDVKEIAR